MNETTVIVEYQVLDGQLPAFTELLTRHYPTLRELGLATETPPQYFVGAEQPGKPTPVVEIFEWSSPNAPMTAHTHPALSAIWERMAQMSAGDGRPRNVAVKPLALA